MVTIDVITNKIEAKLIGPPVDADPDMATNVAAIDAELDVIRNQPVATSDFKLYAFEDDEWNWAVRTRETNLGDLITDAFRSSLDADICLTNGGGIRSDIEADRTYTVVGNTFNLISGGDGFAMWKDAEVITAEGPIDFQTLTDFLKTDLKGSVPSEYADKMGQKRIVVKDGPDPKKEEGEGGSSSSSSGVGALAPTGDPLPSVTTMAVSGLLAATIAAMATVRENE